MDRVAGRRRRPDALPDVKHRLPHQFEAGEAWHLSQALALLLYQLFGPIRLDGTGS